MTLRTEIQNVVLKSRPALLPEHIKIEKCEVKKRGRGRPPKLTRDHFFDTNSKKSKHGKGFSSSENTIFFHFHEVDVYA